MRRSVPAAIAAASMVALVACGGGGSSATAPSTTLPPGVAASITLKGIAFSPTAVSIKVGDSVQWVWDDGLISHNVAFDSFKSSLQSSGKFAHRFDQAGTFHYRCDIHPTMTGTVTVTT